MCYIECFVLLINLTLFSFPAPSFFYFFILVILHHTYVSMVSGGDLCLCFTFSNSDRSLGPPSPRSNAFEHSTISFLKCPKWGLGTSTDDPLTNWQKQKQKKTDKYPLSQGDKRSLYKEWLSLWLFYPPPTPNLLNPNILAPMVQGFELRDLQFEAGSINDNYRVFILPCCKIVHSSLEIGLEELHFYGTILGGSPYSNSLSFAGRHCFAV